VNEQAFYEGVRALVNLPLTNEQIHFAWNALLVGFRKNSIDWIQQNNTKYNTFLYSNTNQIHHDHFIAEFESKVAAYPFVSLFKTPYYSHEMGMRKPDPASFTYIVEKEGLVASETLFIDDNEPNIIAAASVWKRISRPIYSLYFFTLLFLNFLKFNVFCFHWLLFRSVVGACILTSLLTVLRISYCFGLLLLHLLHILPYRPHSLGYGNHYLKYYFVQKVNQEPI
jgi:hypothetical protein